MKNNQKFFIGIDLGVKEKKTTGICILEKMGDSILPSKNWCENCQDVFGKKVLRKISPYLKKTKVISIDAPLTIGRGKGKMRLYEKFLSQKVFRKERVSPIPPALMPGFCNFSRELVQKLERRGFVLDLNLIEVFPTLVKKICKKSFLYTLVKRSLYFRACKNENQKSALICAILGFLHSNFKTRYLGYKDGFLFLPEISFWKADWRRKFYQAWQDRQRLRYHYLKTNVFDR